jgi:hypothetical protein
MHPELLYRGTGRARTRTTAAQRLAGGASFIGQSFLLELGPLGA